MRTVLTIAALLAMALPAAADDVSVYQQYSSIRDTFVGNSGDAGEYLDNFRKQLFDGLDGTWFRIGAVKPQSENKALFASACARTGTLIKVRDAFSAEFTVGAGQDNAMTTTYSARGGNAFDAYTDPAAVAKRLGIDANGPQAQILISALNGTNGTATMMRPSPDVLVVQTNYGMPQIFARCAE